MTRGGCHCTLSLLVLTGNGNQDVHAVPLIQHLKTMTANGQVRIVRETVIMMILTKTSMMMMMTMMMIIIII